MKLGRTSNLLSAFTVSLVLGLAVPSWAGTLQYFESSRGSPGVTAVFTPGIALVASIEYDASSAEGGSLLFGASEITIVPLGDAVLTGFTCQLAAGCTPGVDYVFTPGGAGTGQIVVSDPDGNPQTGIRQLGTITWDSLSSGSLFLSNANYTDANATERTADPFTLAKTMVSSGGSCTSDSDCDGVPDSADLCPGTPANTTVGADGCPPQDSDGDGVPDARDACSGTLAGPPVDQNGCSFFDDCCPCDGDWKNKGAYQSCNSNAANGYFCAGERDVCKVDGAQCSASQAAAKDQLTSEAAHSQCGPKKPTPKPKASSSLMESLLPSESLLSGLSALSGLLGN